jgi:hypothetical protein
MLLQIAIGSGLLLVNIILAAVTAMMMEVVFARTHGWFLEEPHRPKLVVLVIGVSIWVLGMITAGTWIWALAYRALHVFPSMHEAVYFSLVAYTTLGLGDVLPSPEWRLLAGMEAANGFLNFGLLTALLIETLRLVRIKQVRHKRKTRG